MTCEQCYVCEQTVLQCSRTMLLAMTYDLCHGGHMVAEYLLLHTLPPPHQEMPDSYDTDSNCSGGSHISEELNEDNSENWPKRCRYS